jgi:oligopeptide transport system substrate-binding protein
MATDRTRLFLAAALLTLAGCGAEQPEGARLTVTVVGEPGAVAAGLAAEASSRTLIAQGSAGDLLPGLASSWRFVDDGRSLILRLRPEQWSDNKALEAKQVVASLRRAAGRGDPALLATGIDNAQRIAAGDLPASKLAALAPIARVVELRLDTASPMLLGWLAEPGLAVTRTGKTNPTLAAYDSSGSPEQRLLKRRTLAAKPDARPAEIVIASTADPVAAIAAFTAGKTDIVIGDGLAGLGEARAVPSRDALRLDSLWGVYGYRANGRLGPLADAGTRRALALAVDRDALVASFGLAAIEPAEGLVPPSIGLTPQPARTTTAARIARITGRSPAGTDLPAVVPDAALDAEARLAESQRLLTAAGWSADKPLRLVLLVPQGRDHARVAEAVAADWARAGVQLTIRSLTAPALAARLAAGDYDLVLSEASVPVPDAMALLSRYRCGAGLACNPAADALLDEARSAGPVARNVLLARAEAELMTAPPLIPLFTPVRWALVSQKVDGWLPNRAGRHPLGRLAVK